MTPWFLGSRKTVGIATMIEHPDFNQRANFDNDIALLKLDEYVEYTCDIAPACLTDSTPKAEESVIVSGWGYTTHGGQQAFTLQEVMVRCFGDNCLLN